MSLLYKNIKKLKVIYKHLFKSEGKIAFKNAFKLFILFYTWIIDKNQSLITKSDFCKKITILYASLVSDKNPLQVNDIIV